MRPNPTAPDQPQLLILSMSLPHSKKCPLQNIPNNVQAQPQNLRKALLFTKTPSVWPPHLHTLNPKALPCPQGHKISCFHLWYRDRTVRISTPNSWKHQESQESLGPLGWASLPPLKGSQTGIHPAPTWDGWLVLQAGGGWRVLAQETVFRAEIHMSSGSCTCQWRRDKLPVLFLHPAPCDQNRIWG